MLKSYISSIRNLWTVRQESSWKDSPWAQRRCSCCHPISPSLEALLPSIIWLWVSLTFSNFVLFKSLLHKISRSINYCSDNRRGFGLCIHLCFFFFFFLTAFHYTEKWKFIPSFAIQIYLLHGILTMIFMHSLIKTNWPEELVDISQIDSINSSRRMQFNLVKKRSRTPHISEMTAIFDYFQASRVSTLTENKNKSLPSNCYLSPSDV